MMGVGGGVGRPHLGLRPILVGCPLNLRISVNGLVAHSVHTCGADGPWASGPNPAARVDAIMSAGLVGHVGPGEVVVLVAVVAVPVVVVVLVVVAVLVLVAFLVVLVVVAVAVVVVVVTAAVVVTDAVVAVAAVVAVVVVAVVTALTVCSS